MRSQDQDRAASGPLEMRNGEVDRQVGAAEVDRDRAVELVRGDGLEGAALVEVDAQGHVVEAPRSPNVTYCPRCDGPLDHIAAWEDVEERQP